MEAPAAVVERTPGNAKTGLAALYAKGYVSAKLASIDPHEIIARYLSDEKTHDIAASIGVTHQALYAHLLNHSEQDWKDAQVARALALRDRAEEDLKIAPDALALSRAREVLKSAQWQLERLLRRLYGDDKNIQVTVVPVLNISVAPLPVVPSAVIVED